MKPFMVHVSRSFVSLIIHTLYVSHANDESVNEGRLGKYETNN